MSAISILASILSADFGALSAEVGAVSQAGVDGIHVDVMDGHFVPNLTLGPTGVSALRKATALPLDVHLMIEHADRWIDAYIQAGASLVYIHAEACVHLYRTLQHIRACGVKTGIALNPATPITALDHVLHEVDRVLVMTVSPGFGGQAFLPAMLPKIAALKQKIAEANATTEIAVDGGIHTKTIQPAVQAGASVLVAGSAIFGTKEYKSNVAALRAALSG